MGQFDIVEYQTVILSALLHDIGKFLHRGHCDYEGSHEKASEKFLNKVSSKLQKPAFVDFDLLRFLVRYHHLPTGGKKAVKDSFINGRDGVARKRVWGLLKIVTDADSYSCKDRDTKEEKSKGVQLRLVPLVPVFDCINLDTASRKEDTWCYRPSQFSASKSLPTPFASLKKEEIPALVNEFEKKIPDLAEFGSFDEALVAWMNVLEHFTWAIQSDTRYELSDISLFDHLRSSAAIAACLYKKHLPEINAGQNFQRKGEFLLIGGDFSGIQDFIFHISNAGAGGVAKRLRARSFFISMFSEVTIHKILHALELPLLCNVFSAAGKFLVLVPNTKEHVQKLREVKSLIEKEVHLSHFGNFAFLMNWIDIEKFKDQMGVYDFFITADALFHRLESEKTQKLHGALTLRVHEKVTWNCEAFKAGAKYAQYGEQGDCKVCKCGPATETDPDFETEEVVDCCLHCWRDKYIFGSQLPKARYVAFGKTQNRPAKDSNRVVFYGDFVAREERISQYYFAELFSEYLKSPDHYLVMEIDSLRLANGSHENVTALRRNTANHVPVDNGKIISFEEIAKRSRWQEKDKIYGSDLLGVLKADVDNLGLLFNKGFENPRRVEMNVPKADRKTISRFLTMARMMDFFFSGWITDLMKIGQKGDLIDDLVQLGGEKREDFRSFLLQQHINFGDIYTVYSGGDDLILVGPWETMIIFAMLLNVKFRKFTCENPHITLSAGLALAKPKFPIPAAIRQADQLLEKSKAEGKNRITFFGTTTPWENLPRLIEFFLFLDGKLRAEPKESLLSSAFLYKILESHKKASTLLTEGRIDALSYLAKLSYDIERNLVKRDSRGDIIKGAEEQEVLSSLITDSPMKNGKVNPHALIFEAKIPVSWAIFRNRRIAVHENTHDI